MKHTTKINFVNNTFFLKKNNLIINKYNVIFFTLFFVF